MFREIRDYISIFHFHTLLCVLREQNTILLKNVMQQQQNTTQRQQKEREKIKRLEKDELRFLEKGTSRKYLLWQDFMK
jgi:hypothetical protein